jgi:carbonic anhydrase/SulP family sulfate permease
MWEQGYSQFFPFMVTVTAILFTDLLVGVLIGLASSVFFILHRNSQIPIKASIENHLGHQIYRIELPSHVNFLNRASLSESLERLPNDCQVALDASNTKYIDVDVLDMLKDFKSNAALLKNITVSMLGFKHDYPSNDLIFYREHATVDLQKNVSPAQVLEMLKEGNQRVREGKRLKRDLNRQISKTSLGQYPLAVFLSCIDSRVPAELIFDLGIGDAFSVRVAGNITSTNILGSLEFACAIAGAKLLVVMGHTRCGAISAAISSYQAGSKNDSLSSCKHLVNIVDEIQGVIRDKYPQHQFSEQEILDEGLINTIAQANILHTIEDIKAKSPVIEGLVSAGKIGIAGCIYDVNSGEVSFLTDDVAVKGKNKEMGEHPLIKA